MWDEGPPTGMKDEVVFHRDILNIIWRCLWPSWANPHHPLDDLERVLDFQRCIPPCLLRDRLSTHALTGGSNEFDARLYQVFPLNPFKSGNPYHPYSLVCTTRCWSMFPSQLLRMMTKRAFRRMATYRAHTERRLLQHYNRPIDQWNVSYLELFFYLGDLKPEHYDFSKATTAGGPTDPILWAPYLEQVAEARYLTSDLLLSPAAVPRV